MKKIMSLLLTAALALSCCSAAFAAQQPGISNFVKSQTYNSSFNDVTDTVWYASYVQSCYEYGLMNGQGGGKFGPSGNLTVAEALAMAVRVNCIYTTGAQDSSLSGGSPWYAPYVTYAVEHKMITNDMFSDYTAKINRADMAYIFSSALPASELKAINSVVELPDVNSTTPHSESILLLYNAGVLTGSDLYGTFTPENNITRAEAAALITRIALPAQRVTKSYFAPYGNDTIVFAMPVGTTVENNTTDNIPQYSFTSPDQSMIANVMLTSLDSLGFSGLTITDFITKEAALEQLESGHKSQGATLEHLVSSTVKFGDCPAYRFMGTFVYDGSNYPCCYYIFIANNTFYTIQFMASADLALINAQVNSLTVLGNPVSPKGNFTIIE